MSISSNIITGTYISQNAGKYAKIFEIPIGKYGQSISINTFNMSFRVYWITAYGNYSYRDYSLSVSSTSGIVFKNLTPERKASSSNPSPLIAHVDTSNDIVTVYTTGQTVDQKVQIVILQCNKPNYITFLQDETFIEDFSTITPTYPSVEGIYEPSYRYTLFDDFIYQTLPEINTPWILNKGTDPEALDPVIGFGTRGKLVLTTGNDSGTLSADGSQIVCAVPVTADAGGLVVEARLRINTAITNVSVNFGLTDTTALEEPFTIAGTAITSVASDACCFVYDDGATTKEWYACAVDSDVDDTGNVALGASLAPIAGAYQTLRLEVSSDGNMVNFYINNSFVKSLTNTGVTPNVSLYATVIANSTTTTSKTVDVDYIYISHNR